MVGRKGQVQRAPGLLNLVQRLLHNQLLLGPVHDLGAGIHKVVHAQLQQVAQAEAAVHDKVLASGLQ